MPRKWKKRAVVSQRRATNATAPGGGAALVIWAVKDPSTVGPLTEDETEPRRSLTDWARSLQWFTTPFRR